MYRQMDIQVPGPDAKPVFHGSNPDGRDLRKVLAKLNTEYQIGLPPWFFGYAEDGNPDSSAQPRISMGKNAMGSLRIIALGGEASQMLLEKSGPIQAALIQASGTLVQASLRGGAHAIESSAGKGNAQAAHHLRRLVVGSTRHTSKWWTSAKRVESGGQWESSDLSMLEDMIAAGIFDQARALLEEGDEIGGELGEWLESKLATDGPATALALFKQRIGLRALSIGGHTAVRHTGANGLRVMLKDVRISMTAKLEGPWIVGRNRIEGYGLVQSSRVVFPTQAEVTE